MPKREYKRVGIVSNPKKDVTSLTINYLIAWLKKNGMDWLIDLGTAEILGSDQGLHRRDLVGKVDLLVVFGGDGTLLSLARASNPLRAPVLAVNMGRLGFLTTIPLDDLDYALEALLSGDYEIASRAMLDITVTRKGEDVFSGRSLNDVVVDNGARVRLIDLQTYVDDRYLTTYRADGLIIATPTGSTAYALSAGGPILHPGVAALVVAPICPHTLTNRPLIVSHDASIKVILRTRSELARITLDGQIPYDLEINDTVMIRKAENPFYLIRLPTYNYFYLLRTKLHWGER